VVNIEEKIPVLNVLTYAGASLFDATLTAMLTYAGAGLLGARLTAV
jgi:predicted RNA-binding protein